MVPTGWGSSAHCQKFSKSTEINVPQTFGVSLRGDVVWPVWSLHLRVWNYVCKLPQTKRLRNCPDTLDKRTKRSDYWRCLAIFAIEPFTSSTEFWCCRPPSWWYCLLIKVNLKWYQPMNSNKSQNFSTYFSLVIIASSLTLRSPSCRTLYLR